MPYCQRCGAKLEDGDKFCQRCGAPVASYPIPPPPPPKPPARQTEKTPFLLPALILIAIVTMAAIVGAVVLLPTHQVNFNKVNTVNQTGINTINLSLQGNMASFLIQNSPDQTLMLATSIQGSTSIFNPSNPVQVSFSNQTVGDTLTATANITANSQNALSSSAETCQVYISPNINLNLNVTTQTGTITLTTQGSVIFNSLNLKSTTGAVQVALENGTVLAGGISMQTTTGTVSFQINQANVSGNQTVNLQTTTGAANINIAENQTLQGNTQVNATTNTGAINLSMNIDNTVGAKITSQTQAGQINTNLNGFSGSKSPLESYNYPSINNFFVDFKTNVGDININALYQTYSGGSNRN